MDWEAWVSELRTSLEAGDDAEVSRWADRFRGAVEEDDEYVPTPAAGAILELLQNHARFPLLRSVGELIGRRNRDVTLRRRLAQARIEMGEVTRAIGDLLDLEAEVGREVSLPVPPEKELDRQALKREVPEIEGLLGRAYRKLYVDAQPTAQAPREEDYDRAYRYYLSASQAHGASVWPGVNLIALEAFKDAVVSGRLFTANEKLQAHARRILDSVPEDSNDPWDLASRAEALLATGANKAARESLERYLLHPKTTLFMVQSTRRSFRELWRLSPDRPPGSRMLPMLDAAYARKGGPLHVERILKSGMDLEAVLADTGFQPLVWLRTALDRARSIARIGRKPQRTPTSQSVGTGFLVDGTAIHASLAGRCLLLTNAHVATSRDDVRARHPDMDILRIEETKVAFLEVGGAASTAVPVVKEWFTSPPSELDATLLELADHPAAEAAPLAADPVVLKERVNILGHPGGDEMVVSLQDNRVVRVESPRLFYRTPTEPGSSGSPVFNQQWELVALHHEGPAFSKSGANEGLLIGPVLEAIRMSLDAA